MMEFSDILSAMTTFLILLAIAVIALLAILLTMRKRDELRLSQLAIRDDVRERRGQRLTLIVQALTMFGEGNRHSDSLSKLAELYRSIDSEEKEILWEEKYIKVMRAFMATAKKQAPPNMRGAWEMLDSSIRGNEGALDTAREAFAASKESMSRFDSFPQKQILFAGEKLSIAMRTAEYAKRKYDEQLEMRESGDVSGNPSDNGSGSVPSSMPRLHDGRDGESMAESTGGSIAYLDDETPEADR